MAQKTNGVIYCCSTHVWPKCNAFHPPRAVCGVLERSNSKRWLSEVFLDSTRSILPIDFIDEILRKNSRVLSDTWIIYLNFLKNFSREFSLIFYLKNRLKIQKKNCKIRIFFCKLVSKLNNNFGDFLGIYWIIC